MKFVITEEEKKSILKLYEQSTGSTQTPNIYLDCFISQGLPKDKIPQSCSNPNLQQPGLCASEMLKSELYKNPQLQDKIDAALDCFMDKIRKEPKTF